MSSKYNIIKDPPKALTFDVFGTVVDWRKTVTQALHTASLNKTSSSSRLSSLSPALRTRLTSVDWSQFAQEWRNAYKSYTRSYNPSSDPWKDIDTHHYESLISLLSSWELNGLYTDEEIKELSLVWHFLTPWPDSSEGIQKLGKKFVTSTLSNGNQSLLQDLNSHGQLGFQKLQSAEDFRAYKPNEKVYRGSARELGVEMGEVAMVAAHLNDLKAARSLGMRTVYVEREGEEDWGVGGEEWEDARGWVDMWVRKDEGGFLEVARRFGVE
ncbi:haloacid dehalogenase [Mollisia scopiformis]|uniref:Haloacid dehalogenase n=1 Tax=Mollisia scopiformis TaxID=149040 RepID=A0A194WW95_MOLSC|nr:haloacid dehalogenase [Mollisia scopiformis]KUJ11944.1 haloacid dehalogenase [Mollisia scopiformis]